MDTHTAERQNAIREMSLTLARTTDDRLIEDFLRSILTPRELQSIAERWELVQLIDEGMSQRKIAEKLGLSLCKITRGSKELKKENSAFAKMIHSFGKARHIP